MHGKKVPKKEAAAFSCTSVQCYTLLNVPLLKNADSRTAVFGSLLFFADFDNNNGLQNAAPTDNKICFKSYFIACFHGAF